MTRFDMSEYSDPIAVNRLIGGVFSQEGLLTAKVREQPFAVILLDEFEKAHPSFFDLLLQILGEGRLTDSMGRVADFSNAVVIMTSNLGAESFQRGLVGFGQAAATREAASKHFTNAVRTALRPELFNRIDRIAPFAPLDEASALRIAEREIERVRTRDGVRYRGVMMNIRDGVARRFAHRGYDPRYGARPLKRVIERELLVPLSEALNQRKDDDPIQVNVWVEDERLRLDVQKAPGGESGRQSALALPLAELTRRCSSLRREAQTLERSAAARNLQNEIYTLQRIEKRLKRGKWKSPEELARVAELPKLQHTDQAIKDFIGRITELEHETALAFYDKVEIELAGIKSRYSTASADWTELLLRIYTLKLKEPDKITIAVFGEDHRRMFDLAKIYYLLATARNSPDDKVEVRQFKSKPSAKTRKKKDARDNAAPVERTKIEKPDQFFAAPRDNVVGVALGVKFPMAFPKLELERGLHTFTKDRKAARCLVDVSAASIEDYHPPANIARHDAIGHQEKRRNYNADQSLVDDLLLDRREQWSGQLTVDLVEWLIEDSLMAKVKRLIEN